MLPLLLIVSVLQRIDTERESRPKSEVMEELSLVIYSKHYNHATDLNFKCLCVLLACVSVCHLHAWYPQRPEEGTNPLILKL